MNPIKQLRIRLGDTQKTMGAAIGKSQANVSFYEQGHEIPPHAAKRLISYAHTRGVVVTYEDIYGPLPGAPAVAGAGSEMRAEEHC